MSEPTPTGQEFIEFLCYALGYGAAASIVVAVGYRWTHFRASDIGAPHERNRIWIVATNPNRVNIRGEPGWLGREIQRKAAAVAGHDAAPAANADGVGRLESARCFAIERGWAGECGWTLDRVARVDDGRAKVLDAPRQRKALGNAVVMPCARLVGEAIAKNVEFIS